MSFRIYNIVKWFKMYKSSLELFSGEFIFLFQKKKTVKLLNEKLLNFFFKKS